MDEDIDPNQPPDQEVFSLASSSSNSMADDEDLFEPISLRDFSTEADAAGNVKTPSDNVAAGALDSPRKFPPMKSRRKLSISDTPPEILHLVDSAIMGLNESVEMLQSLVFESDESVSLSVVNSLINTMGGAEGLDEVRIDIVPTIMKTTRAAQIACELIPWLPSEVRSRMVKGLLIIIRSCTRNRAMCTIAGLLRMLLEVVDKMIVKSEEWDFKPLCGCLQVLAGHSLSVSDLRFWLDLVKKSLTSDWAMQLILALEKAVGSKEAHGPANSFEFDGESSGLIGPGESKWPFGNGYGFATWVYMESYADSITIAEDGVNMPRLFSYLFSFLSSDNYGVEAYFHGQFLVVETGGGKGKKASIHFSYLFQPRCWYFIGLEHTCKQGLLGKVESEVRLYIDGNLHESRPFEYPKVSKPLLCCCIGTNPQPTNPSLQKKRKQCPIFGEMGPIYIFKEPIGQERMARLASRGGDYLPYFGNGAGLPWLAVNEHIRNLADDSARLDSEIGGSLHLLYHPLLLCGRQCPDVSPSGVSGLLRPAEVLGQIHVASRFRPTESLWSLAYGGPIALLPLTVSKVEMDSLEPQLGDLPISLASAALSAPIFRIISHAIQHAGNNEELCRTKAPELLSRLLHYLLPTISTLGHGQKKDGLSDEELVAAIVSLCQSQKKEYKLKIHLFSTLLLDLKMWSMCSYGLQKKLLSSLADMVFTESSAMRDANALQILLDGCRRCYWVVRETDSIDTFSFHGHSRPLGEVNALIDELLVTIELLIGGAASSSFADDDVRCLISFMVDCPQPNQVARVLHLICRLVVQPNTTRADKFAESFISCGGIESLLFLIQLEAKTGNRNIIDTPSSRAAKETPKEDPTPQNKGNQLQLQSHESFDIGNSSSRVSFNTDIDRMASSSESQLLKNLGGISFSISANSARNNVFNIDNGDGVIVGIINLLGALVTSGHLKFRSTATSVSPRSNIWSSLLHEEGSTMFDDKVSLLLFSLQKAFQAAPQRLMTTNVYTALLGAAINVSSIDEGLNIYDSGHRFEHVQLLLVLLRSLPYASTTLQARAIQDLLFLACSHPENRNCLIGMAEWPECLLEVIISNYEMGSIKDLNGISIEEIEDLVHNFLIIMLEHSMRQKDGWKDVEATVHCAEWLSMIGGSSTGDQRVRREEALPIFKRRLLGGLLDFAARELQVQQTEIMAAAAAGVAAEGLSPEDAKEEADNAVQLSVALAENAVVVLMLVEDHLRLQVQLTHSSKSTNGVGSPANANSANVTRSNSLSRTGSGSFDSFGSKRSSNDTGGLSLDILASMADANGQVSASVMERLTAAAAAEPYESVRCAFISYGSCVLDLAEGWKYRSKLWYGVGLNTDAKCGGGGGGWEHWNNILEKDSNENWVELPLVKKSAAMLQALLLDECAIGGGNGVGVGSGSGMCGIKALYQFLDSDQPFLCMLRMVLVSMREEDNGEDEILMRNISIKDGISEGLSYQSGKLMSSDSSNRMVFRKPRSALLWSVLGPILNMAISESKRQRVLVACCILYSEVWHAVGKDGKPLRKQYIENILPPFVAILRRWRPLLASIHELTSADYDNPLTIDDPALAAESLPIEAALSMITPGWAAAFASPPAAMALAMIAAGTSGGEPVSTPRSTPLRRDTSLLERRTTRLHTFSSFQKPLETPNNKTPSVPKDKAAAKAAALAAARDLERRAKIGTGRGLSAVAMATSAQRRSVTDSDRAKRWNTFEAMASAWTECLQTFDSKSVPGRDLSKLSYNYVAVLVTSFALARNMQRMEMDRRTQVEALNNYRVSSGSRAWRKLVCCLTEMSGLFGPLGDSLCNPQIVFWKLDSTISSMRMRRYMKRDYKVSQHINEDNMNAIVNSPEAHFDTSLIAEAISTNENYDDTNNENMPENNTEHDNVCGQNLLYSTLEVGPIFVPSEADERIILELPSSLVWPHITLQGNFQMTTKRVNFIVDEKSNSNKSATSPQRIEPAKNRSWLISSICQVYSRRYLLRMSALELFMSDRTSYLFDFGSIEGRKTAYRAIVNARPPHLNTCYMETQRPDQLLKKTQLMERWARWEISNFEYLMELNVLAGRSYNDLTQYPVFPWILVDYCSKDLNLENSSAYRDLSKPIGAQNPDRLKKYQERYSTSKDPATHKFHYDTHYSSAETVLYYLGRLEPFATLSIQLHGGKSKLDNHTLSDIGSTWKRALSDMRDVKELVPELFYMPEILMKADSFNYVTLPPWAENPVDFIHKHRMALESVHVSAHLHEWIDLIFGYKQRGEAAVSANNVFHYITYEGMIDIDKVADPVRQRAIQDKISLFGQTPFQLLTVPHLKRTQLEDSLHLKTIFRDPSNIKPFGVPNPEHCNVPAVAISATEDTVIVVDSNAPAANIAMHKWNPNTPDEQGIPFHFHHGESAAGSTSGAFLRMLTGPGSTSEEWQFPHALAFAASGVRNSAVVAITCDNEIITGGHADNSVKLISADKAKTIETASGHCAPVTCLALSPDSNYLVTGSRDTTVILWRMHRSKSQLNNTTLESTSSIPSTPTSPLVDSDRINILDHSRRRIEGPMHVLRGHLEEVVCCCVNSDLGLIASCSNSSGVLLHTIRKGRLIRKLEISNVHLICLSSQGVILVWNEVENKLSTFSVNGIPIGAKVLLPFPGIISCIEISIDGKNALLGTCSLKDNADYMESSSVVVDSAVSTKGNGNRTGVPVPSILFLDLHTLEVFHSLPLKDGQNVTAIALNNDNTNLLVSTADKQLIVFTDPSLSKKAAHQNVRQQ